MTPARMSSRLPAISIHALLAESDHAVQVVIIVVHALFLSTLSLRRATYGMIPPIIFQILFLSTLSLRRATGRITSKGTKKLNFYPRSPCGERRCFFCVKLLLQLIFLSTLSLRRATRFLASLSAVVTISIHALLAESDCFFCVKLLLQLIFLSTLSLRRATRVP